MKICKITPIAFEDYLLVPLSKNWQKIIPSLQFEVKLDKKNRLVIASTNSITNGVGKQESPLK